MDRGYIADRATVLPGRAIFTLPIERKKKKIFTSGEVLYGEKRTNKNQVWGTPVCWSTGDFRVES